MHQESPHLSGQPPGRPSRSRLGQLLASRTGRRAALLFALVAVALAVIAVVLLSPLALVAVNPNGDTDWQRLADVAQTYAAASAILALLALGGIAVSLTLQAREMKATRAQTVRTMHVDILKMAMDDPVYMACWGPHAPHDDRRRQHMYVNLILSYWQMAHDIGELGEPMLRASAADLFRSEPARRFWHVGREVRIRTAQGKRSRRFNEIIDEEYRAAIGPPPPPAPEPAAPEPATPPASPAPENSG